MEAKFLMFNYAIFVVAAFFLDCADCGGNEFASRWIKHKQRADRFKCEVPRPISLYFQDFEELKNYTYIRFHQEIVPSSTVLYRCGTAGCCKDGQKCVARDSKEVTLTFRIKIGSDSTYRDVKAENHTICGCESFSNNIK